MGDERRKERSERKDVTAAGVQVKRTHEVEKRITMQPVASALRLREMSWQRQL
jgi:hypothetical protein